MSNFCLDAPMHHAGHDLAQVRRLLDAVALEYQDWNDGESIYVTGHPFNYWIRPCGEGKALAFQSNWPFAQGVHEHAALPFVNTLNEEALMIQFARLTGPDRLCGHYLLFTRDEVLPRQILRAGCMFATTFRQAVIEGIEQGLVAPLCDAGDGGEMDDMVLLN